MSEFSINEQRAKIRSTRADHNQYPSMGCVQELAQFAISSEFSGFQDPKVDAIVELEAIERAQRTTNTSVSIWNITSLCERDGCNVEVQVDRMNDSVNIMGKCAIEDVCIKPLWESESPEDSAKIRKIGLSFSSKHSAGTRCPHLNCSYSCGFSIDGVPGSVGQCRND